MQSGIKVPDISKISESQTSIPTQNYEKFMKEMEKVKYPVKAISAAQDLDLKIDTFKSTKVKGELKKCLSGLNSYRQVRGDGNCFFRAIGFTYLSHI